MRRLICAYLNRVHMVFALIVCSIMNVFVIQDGLAKTATPISMIVKKIHAQMKEHASIWSMATNATVYLDLKAKIANTCPMIAKVNHAKMVPLVSMKLTVTCANAVLDLLACNAKVSAYSISLD